MRCRTSVKEDCFPITHSAVQKDQEFYSLNTYSNKNEKKFFIGIKEKRETRYSHHTVSLIDNYIHTDNKWEFIAPFRKVQM